MQNLGPPPPPSPLVSNVQPILDAGTTGESMQVTEERGHPSIVEVRAQLEQNDSSYVCQRDRSPGMSHPKLHAEKSGKQRVFTISLVPLMASTLSEGVCSLVLNDFFFWSVRGLMDLVRRCGPR